MKGIDQIKFTMGIFFFLHLPSSFRFQPSHLQNGNNSTSFAFSCYFTHMLHMLMFIWALRISRQKKRIFFLTNLLEVFRTQSAYASVVMNMRCVNVSSSGCNDSKLKCFGRQVAWMIFLVRPIGGRSIWYLRDDSSWFTLCYCRDINKLWAGAYLTTSIII